MGDLREKIELHEGSGEEVAGGAGDGSTSTGEAGWAEVAIVEASVSEGDGDLGARGVVGGARGAPGSVAGVGTCVMVVLEHLPRLPGRHFEQGRPVFTQEHLVQVPVRLHRQQQLERFSW